jgi:rhodanese-related sulfurtransferase
VGILSGGFRGWEACGLPVAKLADKEVSQKADKVAIQLGTKFVEGCLAGVPGGGFCMPTPPAQKPVDTTPKASPAPAPAVTTTRTLLAVQAAERPAACGHQPTILPNTVPTVENVEHIDPKTVYELLRSHQCLLVDLRGEDRSAGLIEGAVHEPAIDAVPFPTKVPKLVEEWANQSLVIFTCQYSAHRAPQCANWYRQGCKSNQRVGILSGGFRGWEAMGLPVQALASGAQAERADEAALKIGTQFVAAS